jgi:hypothetical protein
MRHAIWARRRTAPKKLSLLMRLMLLSLVRLPRLPRLV